MSDIVETILAYLQEKEAISKPTTQRRNHRHQLDIQSHQDHQHQASRHMTLRNYYFKTFKQDIQDTSSIDKIVEFDMFSHQFYNQEDLAQHQEDPVQHHPLDKFELLHVQ